MATIIKAVPASEKEVALGMFVSISEHWSVSIGEYADQGEADIDIRILGAVDEGGNDISERVAGLVANAVNLGIEQGVL